MRACLGTLAGHWANGCAAPQDDIQWPDTGLVAVNADGSPVRPETYSKVFAAHCVAAEVPVIRLHDARHTAATMLLDGGTSPSAAAKWLGHGPGVTLRVYGHVYDDALASAGDALLGRSRGSGGTN